MKEVGSHPHASSIIEKSYKAVPKTLYEYIGPQVGSTVLFGVYNILWLTNGHTLFDPGITAAGVGICLVGHAIDRLSTIQTARSLKRAEEKGVIFPYKESNPDFGPKPSEESLHKLYPSEIFITIASAIVPTAGMAFGAGSVIAAMSNWRKVHRIDAAMKDI